MAFSNANSSSSVTEGNLKALDYYALNEQNQELPTIKDASDLRVLANTQAIANKFDLPLTTDIPLAKDTILVQDNLFFLYNQSLQLSNINHAEVITAIDYYLSSPRNNDIRDFILLGRAIRHYNMGAVNQAFIDLNQLTALYNNNRGQYTYLMGIWAAQQGAFTDALQYLDEANSAGFEPTSIALLKEIIRNGTIPGPQHPIQWNDAEMAGKAQKQRIDELKQLATNNTFNVTLTLKAIAALKEEGIPAQELYELLRQAISINRYSIELTRAYAFQSIESGLAVFGRSALMALSDFVDEQALIEVITEFEVKAEAWRNRPPE
jgi:hypothetical protein